MNILRGHGVSVNTKKGALAPCNQARYGLLARSSIHELFLFWEAVLVIIEISILIIPYHYFNNDECSPTEPYSFIFCCLL